MYTSPYKGYVDIFLTHFFQGQSATRTGLDNVGLAVTGAAFFSDLASPIPKGGDNALYREGASLDSCFGHSADVSF